MARPTIGERPKTRQIATRLDAAEGRHLRALAIKSGLTEAALMRLFAEEMLKLNPMSDAEIAKWIAGSTDELVLPARPKKAGRSKVGQVRRRRESAKLGGLVLPKAPEVRGRVDQAGRQE